MSVYSVIYNLLSTDAPTTGIAGLRIYPVQAPQTVGYPFIVSNVISTVPANTKTSSGESGMDKIRVQVTMIGDNFTTLNTLAAYVRARLDYYWQTTNSGIYVQSITFDGEVDAFNEGSGKDGLYLKYQDYIIIYSR